MIEDTIRESILVVGAGRVGTSLVRSLLGAGLEVAGLVSRDPKAVEARPHGVRIFGYDDIASIDFDVIILAVPDDVISAVAARVADAVQTGRTLTAVHTSGATPASALSTLQQNGASILSLHPIVSFPPVDSTADTITNAHVSLQGDDAAIDWGARLARRLGAHPFVVTVHQKQMLHAAVTFSANYSVTLMEMAFRLIEESGVEGADTRGLLTELHRSVIRNLEATTPGQALTGPVVRGDDGTISTHLHLLDGLAPEVATLYRSLGSATAGLALKAGRIDPPVKQRLEEALAADRVNDGSR